MHVYTAFARGLITGEDETIPETLHELVVAGKEDYAIGILAGENTLDPQKMTIDSLRAFLGIEKNAQRTGHMKIKPFYSI